MGVVCWIGRIFGYYYIISRSNLEREKSLRDFPLVLGTILFSGLRTVSIRQLRAALICFIFLSCEKAIFYKLLCRDEVRSDNAIENERNL